MSRAERLQRLARVQRAIAAEAAAERDRHAAAAAKCATDAQEIFQSLGDGSPLHGLLVHTMAATLQSTAKAEALARERTEAAGARQRREELKADKFGDRARAAARDEMRQSERIRLEALAAAPPARRRSTGSGKPLPSQRS